VRLGEGPLTKRKAGVQPVRPEQAIMPLSGPNRRYRRSAEMVKTGPSALPALGRLLNAVPSGAVK